MSKKLLLRIAIAVPLLLVTCDSADAANRRALRRAARKSLYQRSYQAQPVYQSGIQPTNANSSGKRDPELAFPDICPQIPIVQELDGTWVWYAERHYGEGMNCYNCYIEPTVLVGDYGVNTFEWPYPCDHPMCEPGYHAKPERQYSGQKKGSPVDFAFNPLSEFHEKVEAQEVFPRRYYSFKDKSTSPKTRYFIAYHIKTPRQTFSFAHEVDREVLERENVDIYPLKDDEIQPANNYGSEMSHVYLHKKGDKPAVAIFLLKK